MSIRVSLHHKTTYQYDRLISLGPQTIRLRPAPHCRTPVTGYSLKVSPEDHFINWQQDPHSNYLARLVFSKKTRHFTVEVNLIAEMTVINPFDFFLEPAAEKFPFKYESWLKKELEPFLKTQRLGPRLQAFMATIDLGEQPTNDFLVSLNQRLQGQIEYLVRMKPGVQTCEQTLKVSSGSCRDTAWLLVQILRRLGLAARFVSGYLIQLKPDAKPLEGPAGATHDFTDLHAWAEVYLPGAGWVGLDPTSGLLTGEGHLPLAATPDFGSAAPITGAIDPCKTTFDIEMSVTRIHEDPRVTKPYTDEQWAAIDSLGQQIDEQLSKNDVRLTMGGEPTFVSIDDMDGQEWNTAAMGPAKRRLAAELFERLQKQFAPGALLHYGQGKWYPGEPLPRWALTCYWRRDGQPIWKNPHLIALDHTPCDTDLNRAKQFAAALSLRLGIEEHYVRPAYEDPWHYLLKERQLPINVNPLDNRLEVPEDRERLRRVFERGLGAPAGYVLPLQRAGDGKTKHEGPSRWHSGSWVLRSKHIYLIPGDSPMGLRLPLSQLPWVEPEQYKPPHQFQADPMSPRAPLATTMDPSPVRVTQASDATVKTNLLQQRGSEAASDLDRQPQAGESATWVIRTAVCVEVRDGRLYVFMPPVRTAEDYLDLISTVEETAAALDTPVAIEGYTPPHDHRINHFRITPDPGVIEVNIHPSHDWKQLVEQTTVLYDEAKQTRLGTEKFMLDGRHSGTGGGNHVVLGGPTPADSPFLRRPDLLKSLVGYWLNHPSLSYLFSGLFIGPTSQAPRVDEARHEAVYELETAFNQIPDPHDPDAKTCPPWLVDRALRHLLTDLTGNTHRAEFCIDKLYAPESASGRLGLVELRGFEMPPDARMSLTQQLLVRALVSWFWDHPYRQKLIHWGTRLHDRFMLPYFIAEDFFHVIDDLNGNGLAFDRHWFAAQFEFRFPTLGRINHQGVEIELRQAIEPWNVLGEEPGGGGTARFVDSSLERVQVRIAGLTDGRHAVACNGIRLPLHGTGTHGEFACGVRYRAWQPPSCLHPTIPVHTPLVFDIVDTWTKRSIGGCTYHVMHPGGRSYETFPVNAYEAEARRAGRFFSYGHTPGPMDNPPMDVNRLYPLTLDLRRVSTAP